jgi:lipopolysaccharide transport system ATP-binding protein
MSEIAIRVQELGKRYRLGTSRSIYRTFRETLMETLSGTLSRRKQNRPNGEGESRSFWALKDVSFEVKQGEVVGIIGRNGAGKSTLLKILSRITIPTEGRAHIYGRIGSLLEVGTGFHPELTGRENIFLNGAILGMRREEIKGKFDEIVTFAEVEKFLDTPVKHYSSGMYVRLAFAVAAHLDPEILLVDEVLAVGDASFQKKCLNKMEDIGHTGRTVLFVSHNMPAIRSLCSHCILLEEGVIQYQSEAAEVVRYYLNRDDTIRHQNAWKGDNRPGNSIVRVNSVKLRNSLGEEVMAINISEEAMIEIDFEILFEGGRAQFAIVLSDADGNCVFGSLSNTEPNYYGKGMCAGNYRSVCHIYGHLLNCGRFHVSVRGACAYWTESFDIDHVISFDAVDDGNLKGDYAGGYGGPIRPKLVWITLPNPAYPFK